jgi:hypothetical protein
MALKLQLSVVINFYSYETDVGKFETKNRNDPGGKCSYKRQNNRFSDYCCGSFSNSYNLHNLVYRQNNTLDMRRRKSVMRISGQTIYLVASIIILLAVVLLGEMKII